MFASLVSSRATISDEKQSQMKAPPGVLSFHLDVVLEIVLEIDYAKNYASEGGLRKSAFTVFDFIWMKIRKSVSITDL